MASHKAYAKYASPMLLLSLLALGFSYFWPHMAEAAAKYYEPNYSIRILSYDPLLMHLEGFVSKPERIYLMNLGKNRYRRSKIVDSDFSEAVSDYRTSDTAWLPLQDPVVQRIFARASRLQGYTPIANQEPLQLTRYKAGQQYKPHWDHFHDQPIPANESQRITTIFAILDATCDECGTTFPYLSVDWSKEDSRWCQFVDCTQKAMTIRPVPGNAVFWKNLNVSNLGEYRTLHAGLPPLNGTKVGLNIWTREQAIIP